MQPDYAHHGCRTAYGGGPFARDPGRIVRGSAYQLQAWLIRPPQLERESLNDGQLPLGRPS